MDKVGDSPQLIELLIESGRLEKEAEDVLGSDLHLCCAEGEHVPITQAKRFSHSLDTESKIRVTLETMQVCALLCLHVFETMLLMQGTQVEIFQFKCAWQRYAMTHAFKDSAWAAFL